MMHKHNSQFPIKKRMDYQQLQPLASIHPDAKIGEGVKIGPFVTIDDNVEIGDGTIIDSNAVIRSGARIGKNCHIHSGAVVSDIPQDLKFKGEETIAIISDNTSIREFATIHRGTASKGQTVVGSNCLIMAYCHVAHDVVVGNHVIMSNAVHSSSPASAMRTWKRPSATAPSSTWCSKRRFLSCRKT